MGLATRLATTIALLCCCAAIASGCSLSGQAPLRKALASAVQQMQSGKAVTFHISETVTSGNQQVAITGDGTTDPVHRSTTLKLDMKMAGRDVTMEEVLQGTTVYIHSDAMGNTWYKADIAKMLGASSQDLGQAMYSDPVAPLSLLQSESDTVEKVGAETVEGAATTHYRATVNLAKAAAEPPLGKSPSFSKLITSLSSSGASTIPVDAWIDDSGAIRRYSMSMQLTVSGESATISVDMVFRPQAAPVTIPLPDASHIQDISNSMSGALAPSGSGSAP